MHIKSVAIEAFLSYEKLVMSQNMQLSPGCNLILGKNGSGKSNFLQAVIFALSDKFKSISKQERRRMLHEGVASTQNRQQSQSQEDPQVYLVEVTLDNSQRRIPIEANDLVVRKSYHCQTDKEEYFINNKHIREKELFNLFESGGFSLKSDSQFQIIQQGQVQDLVVKGESGFLAILKEVSGTVQFDEKMTKMQQALNEANEKKQTLNTTLTEISDKLQGLQVDKEAFKEIEVVEMEKRAYQRLLYLQKIDGQNEQMHKLRAEKQSLMHEREVILKRREAQLAQTSDAQDKTQQLQAELKSIETRMDNLQKLRSDLVSRQIETQAFEGSKDLQEAFQAQCGHQLATIKASIDDITQKTNLAEVQAQQIQQELDQITTAKRTLEQEKDILLMKKHAFDELASDPAKRKKFYQDEINKLKLEKNLTDKERSDAHKNVQIVQQSVSQLKERLEENSSKNAHTREQIQQVTKEIYTARTSKKEVALKVKSRMFELDEVQLSASALQTKLSGLNTQLDKLEPVNATLRRLQNHVRQKGSQCFKGLFMDFIECTNAQFNAVVDIAAKQKLFCAIVNDLASAQELLQLNKEIKGGVINIYPLETLGQIELKQIPVIPQEAKSILDFVRLKPEADQRLQKLVTNTFCRVVMVRDYEAALRIAKDNGLTCVTPELQVVYAGAFITKVGSEGRVANNAASALSRIGLYQKIQELSKFYQAKQAQVKQMVETKSELTQLDLDAMRTLQKCETRLSHLKQQISELSFAKLDLEGQLSMRQAKEQDYRSLADKYQVVVQSCENQIKKLTVEKTQNSGTGFEFSQDDQQRLLICNKEINRMSLEVQDRNLALDQVKALRDSQQALLQNSYLKKQNQLEGQKEDQEMEAHLSRAKSVDYKANIEEQVMVKEQLAGLQVQFTEKQAQLDEMFNSAADVGASQGGALGEEELQALRLKTRAVEDVGMRIDEAIKVCQDTEIIITKLGRYDETVFAATKDKELKDAQLKKLVHQTSQKLDKFPRKNRHSQEWYEKYYQKFQELTAQAGTLERTEESIQLLLTELDRQKEKALEENFLSLNKHFGETFKQIVPQGFAELKLVKEESHNGVSQRSFPSQFVDSSQQMRLNSQLYKSIKVKVDFANGAAARAEESKQDDAQEGAAGFGLSHLSGGQKTVVVVSLIFAVLRLDPAPYYILDEFDHALDAQYRASIASLINELSAKSQFLVTTFKPEMIRTAQAKIFEVTFRAKKSAIVEINGERALKIVNASPAIKAEEGVNKESQQSENPSEASIQAN